MDRKTLEYMKERVEKAEKLTRRIEHLQSNKKRIHSNKEILVFRGNSEVITQDKQLIERMQDAFSEETDRLIEELEEELAKL